MSETERFEVEGFLDLADGEMRFCDVGEYGVVVCRVQGELYALEDNCSHADTPLSEGRLRGYQLTCPLHGSSFDVRDGSHSGPPAYTGVPWYQVTTTETGVVLERAGSDDPGPANGYGEPGGFFRTH